VDKKTKRDWVLLCIFIVAMIAMTTSLFIWGEFPPSNEEIQKYFEDYVQKNGELGTGNSQKVSIPANPKMFFMTITKTTDETGKEITTYQEFIDVTAVPKELRATYLRELNVVAISRQEIYDTYTYTDGHKGFVLKFYVTFVDLKTNSIIVEDYFIGEMPPGGKSTFEGDQYGIFPYTSVSHWVEDYFSKNSTLSTQSSEPTVNEQNQNSGLCWTFELSGFSGNRSQVWDKVLSNQIKQKITYEQFLKLVIEKNPGLQEDGYEFKSNKVYLLPVECTN
jgi:hypothetical protein